MEAIQNTVPQIQRKPAANPFFTALANYRVHSNEPTPLHRLRSHLRLLEKCAERGDVRGWQTNLSRVNELAGEASIDAARDLSLRVQLKKMEFTLLFQAFKNAKAQITLHEKQAAEAQVAADAQKAQELLAKAQKLSRLAEQLEKQLLAKTN